MEEKRGTIGMMMLGAVSLDVWIVMIFVNIMAWVPGLTSVVMMGIADYSRIRMKEKISFGPNLVVGIVTFVVVSLGVGLPLWQLLLGTPLMPLIYAAEMDTYIHIRK